MQELFFITILAILAMIFGYNLQLERRTLKLEKKNGAEQEQINQLKKRIEELECNTEALVQNNKALERKIHQLREAYRASQKKLRHVSDTKYEQK